MNDIKVFITVEMSKEDTPKEVQEEIHQHSNIMSVLELTYELIDADVPMQLKITNLPPRRSGFVKASELKNIEGG